MSNRINLLIINDAGLSGGGTENRIGLLLDEYLKRKVFKQIHLLHYTGGRKTDYPGVIFHAGQKGIRRGYKLTRQIIRDCNIGIVQAHNMSLLSPSCVLAAKKETVPVVWLAHDYWPLCAQRSFISPADASRKKMCERVVIRKCLNECTGLRTLFLLGISRWMMQQVDVAVAPAVFLKNLYEKHKMLLGKWCVVKPWICLEKFWRSFDNCAERRNKDIVFVGSLMDFKGSWVAAQALKYVIRKCPGARLVFIGGDDSGVRFKERIEEICKEDNVFEKIVFLGRCNWDQLYEIHKKAGVYICPTVCMESFGLNWAEAMAAGAPVVASRIGSLPELINTKGILVNPAEPQALAEGIIKVLMNEDYAAELSKQGADYARNSFSVERAADEMLEIFGRLVKAY